MIIPFILFLIVYAIGYMAGYLNGRSKDVVEAIQGATKSTYQAVKGMLPDNRIGAGIIKRPTVKDLERRNEPQSVKDAKEAMRETLDQIPELQEHKRLVEQLDKIQP